jgi:3-deoxy-D-manno-octulosonate 8-phosphate phosphatase (KDO 8-P phosphatase)
MKITEELRQRLAAIKMLVLDVDGVLTTGGITYTDSGEESKMFDVKDGLGIRVASDAGLQIALMTGRVSQVVQRRARDLHIHHTLQRVGDKAAALRTLSAETGVPLDAIAYMGDDLNDREAMKLAGVAIAPADAAQEIIAIAHLVTDARGGRGAARQAVEAILKAQGCWDQAVEGYLQGLAERDRARRVPDKD